MSKRTFCVLWMTSLLIHNASIGPIIRVVLLTTSVMGLHPLKVKGRTSDHGNQSFWNHVTSSTSTLKNEKIFIGGQSIVEDLPFLHKIPRRDSCNQFCPT